MLLSSLFEFNTYFESPNPNIIINIVFKNNEVKSGRTMRLGFSMGIIDTDTKWDSFSSVSNKYKAVSVQSLMNRLLGM